MVGTGATGISFGMAMSIDAQLGSNFAAPTLTLVYGAAPATSAPRRRLAALTNSGKFKVWSEWQFFAEEYSELTFRGRGSGRHFCGTRTRVSKITRGGCNTSYNVPLTDSPRTHRY